MKIKAKILENVYERSVCIWDDEWNYVADTQFGEFLEEQDKAEANNWQHVRDEFIGWPKEERWLIVLENLNDKTKYGFIPKDIYNPFEDFNRDSIIDLYEIEVNLVEQYYPKDREDESKW